MPTKDDPAEWARVCRIEALKTTDPACAQLLRKLARHYDELARRREPAR